MLMASTFRSNGLKLCENRIPRRIPNWLGLFMLKISNVWGLPKHLTAISLGATHTHLWIQDVAHPSRSHWGGGHSTCVRNHSSMLRPARRDLRIIKWPTWGNYQQRAGDTHADIQQPQSEPHPHILLLRSYQSDRARREKTSGLAPVWCLLSAPDNVTSMPNKPETEMEMEMGTELEAETK